jgi:hypothetical protein
MAMNSVSADGTELGSLRSLRRAWGMIGQIHLAGFRLVDGIWNLRGWQNGRAPRGSRLVPSAVVSGFPEPSYPSDGRPTTRDSRVSNRHSSRTPATLLDEFSSRTSSFRPGRPIRLADGQTWVIPAPPMESEWTNVPLGPQYADIVQAILDVNESAELCLAELAFAILLLGQNYSLSPADFERLLGAKLGSYQSRGWQIAFHQIAQDHVRCFKARRMDHAA